jgi:cell wall-associated NlpC family hydrolase
MRQLIDYALSFVGTPYLWGGNNPLEGFDCSGLVQEILASVGADPPGDQSSRQLFKYFSRYGDLLKTPERGALVFYGSPEVNHVGFVIDYCRMVEAGGGDRSCWNVAISQKKGAFVRVRPVNIRADLVAILMPRY